MDSVLLFSLVAQFFLLLSVGHLFLAALRACVVRLLICMLMSALAVHYCGPEGTELVRPLKARQLGQQAVS